jgi:TolA-binding protein
MADETAPPSLTWRKRLARGDFQGVVAEAERAGIDQTLGTATVADLAALADAARYLRERQLARRALLAVRQRFPDGPEAADAAFFLGGLVEHAAGHAADGEALAWYQRYLGATPQGTYAGEALGREMVLVHRLQGAAAARPVATTYLSRFPDGPYAAQAAGLLRPR